MEGSNLKLSIGVIVGSLVLIGGIVFAATALEKPTQVDVAETVGTVEGTNTQGNPESEIVIVEFSDFQCPACGAAFPEVKEFVEQYADQVQFVYRHFPLPQHGNARPAAYAAESAGRQGRFWEVHDWLFENQNTWSDATVDAEYFYDQLSEELELDRDRFVSDYQSNEVRDKVALDAADARGLGVNSTPTFFINGQKQSGVISYDQLVELTGVSQ